MKDRHGGDATAATDVRAALGRAWDLTGTVALLTVDGRGWGPTLAGALAEAGADVVVAGDRTDVLSTCAERVRERGRQVLTLSGAYSDTPSIEEAVARTTRELGGCQVLVNTAQVEFGKPFVENRDAEWEAVLGANLWSVLRWTRAVGAHMLDHGGGRIVNLISGLSDRGLANQAVYAASQGAVQQVTRSLALEWARSGIRVNAIAVGWYEAERRPVEEQQQELLVRYLPLRRKGHPSDVAALLVYLASEASGFVTGETIHVDGGAMAHA